MIVVGDVSHVKKSGKHDNDPVKEAEAIIGKRLPLVPPRPTSARRGPSSSRSSRTPSASSIGCCAR